jgi:hypothetical protein
MGPPKSPSGDPHHVHVDVVDRVQGVAGHDGPGWADTHQSPLVEQGDPVCAEEGLIGVMRGQDDGDAAADERSDLGEDADLIAEIEVRCRLIQHENRRLLG